MDKVKFFAIFLPVLIGLAFLFRVLIPIVIGSLAVFILTMIIFNKNKGTRGGFFNTIRARDSTSFVCLGCGFYHNEESCPKCGSKIKKFYESK